MAPSTAFVPPFPSFKALLSCSPFISSSSSLPLRPPRSAATPWQFLRMVQQHDHDHDPTPASASSAPVAWSRRQVLVCAGAMAAAWAGQMMMMEDVGEAKAELAPTGKKGDLVYVTEENGLKYAEIKKGKGAYPANGDLVILNYIGYLSDENVFDNSESPGRKPLAFQMGKKQVIPAWEQALAGMQPGGVRRIIVPPELAYGERGVCFDEKGCLIPPNETLIYDLKLLRVSVTP